jgi:uncharacterized protein (TIGR00661 family)
MKILYAIQGTGNGHVSRARDIIPALQKHGKVDLLLSGIQADVSTGFDLQYQHKGLSFIFGKNGGVDVFNTVRKARIIPFIKSVQQLPVEDYDLVLSDFEPISSWACKTKNIKCVGLSHQWAVNHPASPRPEKKDLLGNFILQHYAPVDSGYGFHFSTYHERIFTPVIRSEIRYSPRVNNKHYTVYLPAYSDDLIINVLSRFPKVYWNVFSKHSKKAFSKNNIQIIPIRNDVFISSLASSQGVLCGAGFETPAEALYLQKKLMVIPMQGQYEQQCNAAALAQMNVPVIPRLSVEFLDEINRWLLCKDLVRTNYPDQTQDIINRIVESERSSKAPIAASPLKIRLQELLSPVKPIGH